MIYQSNLTLYKYHGDEHQDINEFMLQLLEYLHQQVNKKHNPPPPPKDPSSGSTDIAEPKPSLPEKSPVVDFFEGMLTRTRQCPVGHISRSREVFRVLPLQFPHDVPTKEKKPKSKNKEKPKPLQLESMLEEMNKEESLEW
jgi:hypothetical protein